MKLTCEAVEDFYVLYQEDELHTNVKKAVEEHLQTCDKCQNIYKTGDNFTKAKKLKEDDSSNTPSNKLDNQIKTKLKLRRMRFILLFIVTIFIVYSFFQYVDDRKNMLYEVSSLEGTVRDLYFEVDRVKSEGDPYFRTFSYISDLNEKTARISRHANVFEERQIDNHPYQLHLTLTLNDFNNVLHNRYKHGQWTDRDEEALNRMSDLFDEFSILLTDERLKLNDVYDYSPTALFTPFNGDKLVSIHQDINYLAYSYSYFQKFPEEVEILTEQEMKQRAREVFQAPEAEVTLGSIQSRPVIKGNGTYSTMIEGENKRYNAEWEAYTGNLLEFNNRHMSESGELLPVEDVREQLDELIPRLFNNEEFQANYKGLNYNFSSNLDHQIYTYQIIPAKDGFETNARYRLYIDARTGNPQSLITLDQNYFAHLPFSPININVSKEEGIERLQEKYPDATYSFQNTEYVPSILSNQYELVHQFEREEGEEAPNTIYLNTRSGEEEALY
ncbi:zf-HC2 domain-containing protein [Aquibacillus albus]|uniref:Small secreted protein n=1 Tax=Aquibacillus albus TaxID=1168171 RepID=A0ABS2N3F7_9BACI|nr:zf-HC2 domain-containing protein [Aquibacillus albus]MBM7572641.1 putative small secreted protein [Aquibacillus albus]